jgi:hypothetical protein
MPRATLLLWDRVVHLPLYREIQREVRQPNARSRLSLYKQLIKHKNASFFISSERGEKSDKPCSSDVPEIPTRAPKGQVYMKFEYIMQISRQ